MTAETLHTPGMWKAEDRGHRVHDIRFFWLVPDKVSMGTANPADAKLAAAAPDLLAVAQMVVEASEVAGFSGPLGDAARTAIAKATDHAR